MTAKFANGKMPTVHFSKCFHVISEISEHNDNKAFLYLCKKILKWLHFYYLILLRSDKRLLSSFTYCPQILFHLIDDQAKG